MRDMRQTNDLREQTSGKWSDFEDHFLESEKILSKKDNVSLRDGEKMEEPEFPFGKEKRFEWSFPFRKL